jgi:hypothetical protein
MVEAAPSGAGTTLATRGTPRLVKAAWLTLRVWVCRPKRQYEPLGRLRATAHRYSNA